MKREALIKLAAVAAVSTLTAAPAFAFESGDWVFKSGLTSVDPEQGNGTVDVGSGPLGIEIDDDTSLSLTGAYFLTPAIAVELLASLPFEHDFTVAGLAGGSTKHLPPTLGLQYHFNSAGSVVPYVGVGVNWTTFFSTKNYGQLAAATGDAKLELDDSFGYALQIGADYMFTDELFMNVDVRYIQIESDVKANGTKIGKAEINPVTVGINVGYRF